MNRKLYRRLELQSPSLAEIHEVKFKRANNGRTLLAARNAFVVSQQLPMPKRSTFAHWRNQRVRKEVESFLRDPFRKTDVVQVYTENHGAWKYIRISKKGL